MPAVDEEEAGDARAPRGLACRARRWRARAAAPARRAVPRVGRRAPPASIAPRSASDRFWTLWRTMLSAAATRGVQTAESCARDGPSPSPAPAPSPAAAAAARSQKRPLTVPKTASATTSAGAAPPPSAAVSSVGSRGRGRATVSVAGRPAAARKAISAWSSSWEWGSRVPPSRPATTSPGRSPAAHAGDPRSTAAATSGGLETT